MTRGLPGPEPVSRWVGLGDPLLVPMLDELTAEYLQLYGPGARDEMARHPAAVFVPPRGGVLALVADGVAVASGAFRPLPAGEQGVEAEHTAEIKRMWTAADHRRRGLARRVLAELEAAASAAGYTTIHLSTGWRQPDAVQLYLATGYRPLFELDGDPAVPFERAFTKHL